MACMAFETGRSFDPAQKNLAGSGACVDLETEILTVAGWKKHDEVSTGTEIYSVDFETGRLVHDQIQDMTRKTAPVVSMWSRSFDSVSSLDHRWYVEKRDYNTTPAKRSVQVKTTEEMVQLASSHLYSFVHPHFDYDNGVSSQSVAMLELIAMIAGDGSIDKSRGRVQLDAPTESRTNKRDVAQALIDDVFPDGVTCRDTRNGMVRWAFNANQSEILGAYFDKDFNVRLDQKLFVKKLAHSVFASLSAEGAQALLRGYLTTDGHYCKSNGTTSFRNAQQAVINDFMHVAVLCGENPRQCTHYRGGQSNTFPGGREYVIKDIHTVWLRKSKFTSANKAQLQSNASGAVQEVWCPTTINSNWVARRGGTVYVTGNCGLIQFMPRTALGLSTTVDKLAQMTALEQLDYVEAYFEPYSGRLNSLGDMYMAILWPAGIGQPDEYVLWRASQRPTTYRQNSGLDTDSDRTITKAEATGRLNKTLTEGREYARLVRTDD